MSRKRNKWKFSPARKRRPIGQLPSSYVNDEEVRLAEEIAEAEIAAEETVAEEIAEAEAAAEETVAEEIAETEAAAEETAVEEIAETEAAAKETVAEETAEAEAAAEEITEAEAVVENLPEEFAIEDSKDSEDSEKGQADEAAEKAIEPEPADPIASERLIVPEAAAEVAAAGVIAAPEAAAEVTAAGIIAAPEAFEEEAAEEEAAEEAAAEEEAEEVVAEEVDVEESGEWPGESAAGEEPENMPEEMMDEALVEEPISEPRHVPTLDEIFGEETAAAKELPDYFFDEDDLSLEAGADEYEPEIEAEGKWDESIFEEEDSITEDEPRSLYEWGQSGKKRGKKKNSKKNKKNKEKDSGTKIVRIGGLALGDGIPKICIPVTGRTREQILSQAREAAAMSPDMVEWRVDYLEEAGGKRDIVDILFSLSGILGNIPLLFTYRTEGEGGNGRVGWSHYAELLEWAACRPEIDLIDVEAMGLDVDTEGLIRVIHGRGTPVIASVHYCGEMPGKKERKEALRFLKQSGGDIIKIAVTPETEEDVLELMAWTRKQSRKMEQPLITVAMGDVGKISRISGRLTGSAVTFGSVSEASAAGQIPAAELKKIIQQV